MVEKTVRGDGIDSWTEDFGSPSDPPHSWPTILSAVGG